MKLLVVMIAIFLSTTTNGYGNVCPDKKSVCPGSTSCCLMSDGEYGCCPFVEAICCTDGRHCCPKGTTCDLERKACDGQGLEIPFPWMLQVYAREVVVEGVAEETPAVEQHHQIEPEYEIANSNDDVKCPDGSLCGPSATCCQMPHGIYGCCPFLKGNCCSDKEHCCPSNRNCDLKHGRCVLKSNAVHPIMRMAYEEEYMPIFNYVTDEFEKTEDEVANSNDDVKCADGSICGPSATCCQMPHGKYGCCPFPQGNCCSDKEHCCPSNRNCDVKHGKCILKSNAVHPLLRLAHEDDYLPIFNYVTDEFEIPTTEVGFNDVRAALNDDPNSCNNPLCPFFGGQCCKNIYGGPLDLCCPIGTQCPTSGHNICFYENGDIALPIDMSYVSNIFEHESTAHVEKEEERGQLCPDKTQFCASSETCCPYASGGYACCPFAEATCCADKLSCCHNGYICTTNQCERKPAIHIFQQPQFLDKTVLLN